MATGLDAIKAGAPADATGAIRIAPYSTELPTSFDDKLVSAYVKLGYVSEDGLTVTTDISEEKIKDWSGTVVKVLRTEHSETYKFALLESANPEVLKGIFGEDRVKVSGDNIKVISNSKALAPRRFVFDMLDEEHGTRIVVPRGTLKISGDVKYVKNDVVRYECEVEATPDEDGNVSYTYQGVLKPTAASVPVASKTATASKE
ncbi:hypothetical protein ODZ83_05570 [Acaricomes phytoseiuli]|uniref:phage tail tube protein n=1 Tax=Acaricomes phytoseiuli TaxID=291968 RepID=UPI0022233C01|nr:hypothetical protein [Acaricomes phytoseiuli]MCW1249660.1 hypothetical protein [Acaricomes phytoseiuli]